MIPFSKPYLTGKESGYISESFLQNKLSGDGAFTLNCSEWLVKNIKTNKALLTNSCTAALEMSSILADIKPGDEVIMPSYTFVSTANAFVLRGAIPVFVDIREDTQNLNENLIEQAISKKTKAIVPVHYAGVACEMDSIQKIAKEYGLLVIEDAAQAILSTYKNKMLGSIGDIGCFSFHDTKNIVSGEGGAILINNINFADRAEIIREKGTNRKKFIDGIVDKYSWVDHGSSYLPSELTAAFLFAQLENAHLINEKRLTIWNKYHESFLDLEKKGFLSRPNIPSECKHNGHMYYLILNSEKARNSLIQFLKKRGIVSVFHYIPLHSSPFGEKHSIISGDLDITNRTASQLLRLPLWPGLEKDIEKVIQVVHDFFK